MSLMSIAPAPVQTNQLAAKDFGPVNYILSQSLKLSLISYESRRFNGRTYIFRKTKNRQDKSGAQTGTYWRCMKCEEIIKTKVGRLADDGEGSGRLVVINDKLITDPEESHHSECTGEDDKDVKAKQIVRRKRLLCAEKCSLFNPKRKKNGWKTYAHQCDCDVHEETDSSNVLNAIRVIKEEEFDQSSASTALQTNISVEPTYSNGIQSAGPSWASTSDDSSVCHSLMSTLFANVKEQTQLIQSNKWMLYFSPDEKILSICNENDEIFKILQNRSKEMTPSSKCVVCHYFQSPNFDARSLLPEIYKFVLNLLNKNFVF